MGHDKCWVCEGTEPKGFVYKCKKHDVCDVCNISRNECDGTAWGTRTGFICNKCLEAKQIKAIEDFKKEETRDIDFQYNDYVKCPHCGYEYHPDDLYESSDEEECPTCGSYIDVEVEWTVSYSTTKSLIK